MMPPRRTKLRGELRDGNASIRATDSDASQARISAVRKQYLHDPFIHALVQHPHLVPARPPLINIGTYIRSEAIDELVIRWLESVSIGDTKVQIVSLGAGSDTRFWRLATAPLSQGEGLQKRLARYLELDFPEITSRKIEAIGHKSELGIHVGKFSVAGDSLTSDIYAIHDVDLRDFRSRFSEFLASSSSHEDEGQGSNRPLLDPSLPTLVLAECVLVYMSQPESDSLIQWFADNFSVVGVIVYEMFGLNDNFGKVMRENLRSRDVALPGVDAYPTLEAQSRRFTNHGFNSAQSLSLRTIRSDYISPGDLYRIARLELLDEIEELELVLHHYVISWGWRAADSPAADGLASWSLKPKKMIDAPDNT